MNADELRARFADLPPLPPVQTLDAWGKHRRSLRHHIVNNEDDIATFTRWSTVQATMFRGDCPETRQEWDVLAAADRTRWTCATVDPGVGGAERLPYAPHTNGNLVHQAYHLYQWEKATGKRVDSLESIVEFGGGYGAMALVCQQLGFEEQYTIYDLPEFSLLQRYYLDKCGLLGVECVTDRIPYQADLYIACYSLSEIPLFHREHFIPDATSAYLIASADSWDGVDNNEWAQEFMRERPGIKWMNVYNTISPGHWYLIGAKP